MIRQNGGARSGVVVRETASIDHMSNSRIQRLCIQHSDPSEARDLLRAFAIVSIEQLQVPVLLTLEDGDTAGVHARRDDVLTLVASERHSTDVLQTGVCLVDDLEVTRLVNRRNRDRIPAVVSSPHVTV